MLDKKEMALKQLDYDMQTKEIDKLLNIELFKVKEILSEKGVICEDVHFDKDTEEFPLCVAAPSGIYIFYKAYQEITDLELFEKVSGYYSKFLTSLEGLEGANLQFYLLLNTPITQKPFYGLFNPNMEFLTPISNLTETVKEELRFRPETFGRDEIASFSFALNALSEEKKAPSSTDTYFEDRTGRYVKKRGQWYKLSDINPETYFALLITGGLFGFHKFYVKKYGSFLAYFFTLGFCGIGWLFDMLEVFFGIARDRKKFYIGPFENKKEKLVSFLIAIPFMALIIFGIGFFLVKVMS